MSYKQTRLCQDYNVKNEIQTNPGFYSPTPMYRQQTINIFNDNSSFLS